LTNRITPPRTPPAPAAASPPPPPPPRTAQKPAPGRLRGASFGVGRGIAHQGPTSTGRPQPRGQASGRHNLKQVAHPSAHEAAGHAHAALHGHGHGTGPGHADAHATEHDGGHGGGHGGDGESDDGGGHHGQDGQPQHGGGGGRGGSRRSIHAAPYGPGGPPRWLTDTCTGMGGLDKVPAAYAQRLTDLVHAAPGGAGPVIRKPWLGDAADVLRFTQGERAGDGGLAEVRGHLMAAMRDREPATEPTALQQGLNVLLPLMLLNMQRPRTPAQLDSALSRLAVTALQAPKPAVSLRRQSGEE
jgi:hypothetical protein